MRNVFATAAALSLIAGGASAASVTVQVLGVKKSLGVMRVALCPQADFLKSDCPYNGHAPAQAPATTVTIDGVAPGTYAAQVFQDEHNDGRLHRGAFGVPAEPVGFSGSPSLRFHAPRFKATAFTVGEDGARISLTLRYTSE